MKGRSLNLPTYLKKMNGTIFYALVDLLGKKRIIKETYISFSLLQENKGQEKNLLNTIAYILKLWKS